MGLDLIITSIAPDKFPLPIEEAMVEIPFIAITCGVSENPFPVFVTICP
jgi:hypothetical protein